MQDRREKPQFRLIVTAQLQRQEMFVIAQSFSGRYGRLQDKLRVRQKEIAFLGQGDIFAGAAKQFYIQFFFQRLNLVGDRRG